MTSLTHPYTVSREDDGLDDAAQKTINGQTILEDT
jgi:hypothetical protein